jgi:hypothetical protein
MFEKSLGKKPSKYVLDWRRDGKRLRELPADYTADQLIELVGKFFEAPGYVTKGFGFKDFLEAIPRLLKEEARHERRIRPVARPSADFSGWRDWQR